MHREFFFFLGKEAKVTASSHQVVFEAFWPLFLTESWMILLHTSTEKHQRSNHLLAASESDDNNNNNNNNCLFLIFTEDPLEKFLCLGEQMSTNLD
jgi:hypothetical protein